MSRKWHQRNPALVKQIRTDLREHYPNLHLFIEADGSSIVRGTFPVVSPQGQVLDRYQVSIELLADYPKSLPIVRELGGRIPWKEEFHVEPEGKACVLLPDERWNVFPEGASFRQFLDGPVYDFFLGQSLVALGENWPFGEWGHGAEGIYEYYCELFQTDDALTVLRFLYALSKLSMKVHWDCPCGSGLKIRKCCQAKITGLRRKIPPAVARKARERLGMMSSPYKGPRLR
jgi:hypothetical protein